MTKNRLAWIIVAVLVAVGCSKKKDDNDNPGVVHDTDITADETWAATDSPHLVPDCIYVGGDDLTVATLTVEAGAEIRFGQNGCLIVGDTDTLGALVAVGTSSDRIVFTANTSSPVAGYWRTILFGDFADSSTALEYVTIEYGGQVGSGSANGTGYEDGAIVAFGNDTPAPTISIANTEITDSGTRGIAFQRGARFGSGSTSLTITGSGDFPVFIEAEAAHTLPTDTGSDYTGNASDGIEVDTGSGFELSATGARTWGDPGVPYVTSGQIWINGSDLTIASGTDMRFTNTGEMYISTGTLTADGVTFRGWPNADSTWGGIYFELPGGGSITNSTLEYGGTLAGGNSNGYIIYVDDGNATTAYPTISGNTIQNSLNDGMATWDVPIGTYQANTFLGNANFDIYDYFNDQSYTQ